MASTLHLALATAAFMFARPVSTHCVTMAGEWRMRVSGSAANDNSLPAGAIGTATLKRIAPGVPGGLT